MIEGNVVGWAIRSGGWRAPPFDIFGTAQVLRLYSKNDGMDDDLALRIVPPQVSTCFSTLAFSFERRHFGLATGVGSGMCGPHRSRPHDA